MNQQIIEDIKIINNALKPLHRKVVFVGGSIISLYSDEKDVEEFRPTDDIDIVFELWNYTDFTKLNTLLLKAGFINDITSPISTDINLMKLMLMLSPQPLVL